MNVTHLRHTPSDNPDSQHPENIAFTNNVDDDGPIATVAITERPALTLGTGITSLLLLTVLAAIAAIILLAMNTTTPLTGVVVVLLVLYITTICSGVCIIPPGHTRVVQFLGKYVGTVRDNGMVWTYPFTTRKKVSIRVNNFETNELKINDEDGNPVTTAAIIVWNVADTARASFAVEDYQAFVFTQAESALRHVISEHPYDEGNRINVVSLRGSTDSVSQELADEVSARVAAAGIQVIEARISSLAYSPEIAQAMLQRQQAAAVVAARERIVDGAVSMVQDALQRLEADDIVQLDNERRAAMVSNLLVVLCSDNHVSPVVNTGTLYN